MVVVLLLLPRQADQIELQLDLIKKKKRRSRTMTVSPSVSPAGPGSPVEVDTPALMTSHQRSHIELFHLDTSQSTSDNSAVMRSSHSLDVSLVLCCWRVVYVGKARDLN